MTVLGRYNVYEDGALIAQATNTVTLEGRRSILSILAGRISPPGTMLYGCASDNLPASTQKTLDLPVGFANVVFATPLYDADTPSSSKIVYKSRVPEGFAATIHEVGMSYGSVDSPLIVSFGATDRYTSHTFDSLTVNETDARIGTNAIDFTSGEGTLVLERNLDASGAIATDEIVLGALSSAGSNVTVVFTDVNGYTATGVFAVPSGGGYELVAVALSAFSLSNPNFEWGSIVSVSISVSATTTLDGLVVRSENQNGVLFSRAKFVTPVVKKLGSKMDIEYELVVPF